MKWKTNKGYSRREGVTRDELWRIATEALGLNEAGMQVLIALEFDDFINGKDLKPGLVRQMTSSWYGVTHYMRLEEYDPENFKFAISISSEHLDKDTVYLIIRNEIKQMDSGAIWYIEVSEKSRKRSLIQKVTGSGKGFGKNISTMFHGHHQFVQR